MTTYTTTLTIIVPAAIKALASTIAKAFDPDVGGERSFDIIKASDGTKNFVVSHSPCNETLAAQTGYMLAAPDVLHEAVAADYTARWPELPCPTLDDCTTFAAQALCFVGMGLDEALSLVPLTRILPQSES